MGEEAVPVKLAASRIECPVRRLGVYEDNSGTAVASVIVAPYIILAIWPIWVIARCDKPRMCIARVIEHQVNDNSDISLVCLVQEESKILYSAELRKNLLVITNIVATVTQRRIKDW